MSLRTCSLYEKETKTRYYNLPQNKTVFISRYYITITLMFRIEIVCSKTQRKICNVVSVLITLYDCVDIQKKDVFDYLFCILSKNAVTMI